MIYKLTSVKHIIAKVLADYNMQEENHRIIDFISWCSEALLKIDAFPYYTIKITGKEDLPLLEIEDYQITLPDDVYEVIGVKYATTENGYYYPLRQGTGSYGPRGEESSITSTEATANTAVIFAAMDLYNYTYSQALEAINSDSIMKSRISSLLAVKNRSALTQNEDDTASLDYVYYVTGNYLKFNVKEGWVKLAYKAVPIDDEGYPLVPDDESFMEAIYWYIVLKLQYPEWVSGRIRDVVYYDTRNNWNFHCKQAYGKAMMPNVDKMESLKNQWLQLYPELNSFDSAFSNIGTKQTIYTH
jgi:hypothetical protein